MREDSLPLSASALVIGVLLLGGVAMAAVLPSEGRTGPSTQPAY